MTIGNLWLPSIQPVRGQTFPAAFGVGFFNNNNAFTLPEFYTTQTHDCVVVILQIESNSLTSPGLSGLGATWVLPQINHNNTFDLALFVGYGCTAGNTAITPSGLGSVAITQWAIGVFPNLAFASSPVVSSVHGETTATSITSPSLSYSANQVLVAGGAGYSSLGSNVNGPAVWSNGQPEVTFGAPGGQFSVTGDAQDRPSGSSTTVQYSAAHNSFISVVAANLTHL